MRQVTGYLMSPCSATSSARRVSESGPIEVPSPITSRVTPWRIPLSERPSSMSDSVAQLSMLMKPGATARPVASTSMRPRPSTVPTATMESPTMATSPVRGVSPLPSSRVPPRMTTS